MQQHANGVKVTKQQIVEFLTQLQLASKSMIKQVQEILFFDYAVLMQKYITFFTSNKIEETSVIWMEKNLFFTLIKDVKLLVIELSKTIFDALAILPDIGYSIVHQDLHSLNICSDEKDNHSQIIVIDWEYGGWGNPWLDIAAVNKNFSIDKNDLKHLPSVRSLSDKDFQEGLFIAVQINEALDCIWWLYRTLRITECKGAPKIKNKEENQEYEQALTDIKILSIKTKDVFNRLVASVAREY